MNDTTLKLTLAIAGVFYFGNIEQWRHYANVLMAGKIRGFTRPNALRSQSVTIFFKSLRDAWNHEKGAIPQPENYGLTPLIPGSIAQAEIIDALLNKES